MTLDRAADRYWVEIGQHHKRSDTTFKSLEWLCDHLGEKTLIRDITDSDVARLVAKRRGERVVNVARDGKPSAGRRRKVAAGGAVKLVSPARVNRSVTEPLRKILLRARKAWGVEVPQINWRAHMLKEPRERIRSASLAEEAQLFAALPPQWHEVATFLIRMGTREAETCALTWQRVDLDGETATFLGKGDKIRIIPLPEDIVALLRRIRARLDDADRPAPRTRSIAPDRAGDRDRVFRYANGQPITVPGLASAFKRAAKAAGLPDWRPVHDLRHTAATRLVKSSGNLKLAQKLLGHEDIMTTAKYAHVFDEDLRAAMNLSHRANMAAKVDAAARECDGNRRTLSSDMGRAARPAKRPRRSDAGGDAVCGAKTCKVKRDCSIDHENTHATTE